MDQDDAEETRAGSADSAKPKDAESGGQGQAGEDALHFQLGRYAEAARRSSTLFLIQWGLMAGVAVAFILPFGFVVGMWVGVAGALVGFAGLGYFTFHTLSLGLHLVKGFVAGEGIFARLSSAGWTGRDKAAMGFSAVSTALVLVVAVLTVSGGERRPRGSFACGNEIQLEFVDPAPAGSQPGGFQPGGEPQGPFRGP